MLRRSFLFAVAALAMLTARGAAAGAIDVINWRSQGRRFDQCSPAVSNGAGQVTFTITGTGQVTETQRCAAPFPAVTCHARPVDRLNFTSAGPVVTVSSTVPLAADPDLERTPRHGDRARTPR